MNEGPVSGSRFERRNDSCVGDYRCSGAIELQREVVAHQSLRRCAAIAVLAM
jgi:hypothetical protein